MSFSDFSPFNELSYEDNLILYSALNQTNQEQYEHGPPSRITSFPSKLPQVADVPTWTVYSTLDEGGGKEDNTFAKPMERTMNGQPSVIELEQRLQELKNENWMIKKEHEMLLKDRLNFNNVHKPAPLLRSFSSELRDSDREMEGIMNELEVMISRSCGDDDIQPVLERLHMFILRRQDIMTKEAQQFASPKMQEGLVRLDGITNSMQSSEDFAKWVESLSKRGVSEEQKISIKDLLTSHYAELSDIHETRKIINQNIRNCYVAKTTGESVDIGEFQDVPVLVALANQIEQLKKSIQMETDLFSATLDQLSVILTPYQEAELMVKHYGFYKDNLSTYQLLNNIWNSINAD